MNKSYKSVWNESTGSWVAVSELATGRSKSKRAKTAISKAILTQIAVGGMGLAGASIAMAGDPVKLGTGSTVNVADGVAIGTDATVDADVGANASKTGGVAIGDQSYVAGSGVAIGQNASAGSDSLAMGTGATASLGSTAIGQNATSFNKLAVALGQNATAGGENSLALGANSTAEYRDSVAIGQGATSDRTNSVSFGNGTLNRQLTNVADGTQDSDAVTLKQLKNIGVTTDTNGTVTNSFVAYDANSSKGTVTLQGASGTKITNLAAGAVTAASKDAVNGSQLMAVAQSAADIFGGASTVGPDGKISKPTYTIDGKAYTSLDSALTAAAATGGGSGGTDPLAVHYVDGNQTKVALGTTGTPVTVSNVADGVAATDAVNKEQLDGVSNAVTAVSTNMKYLRFGASTAQVANAVGADALALGGNAYAMQAGAVAIGRDSNVSGKNSVAIGLSSNAQGANSVALGYGSSADDANVVSVGSFEQQRRVTNVATGTDGTDAVNLSQVEDLISKNVVKSQQQVVKSTRTLLGASAAPALSDVVAVGTTDKLGQTEAIGQDAVAIGLGAHATNDNTVAVGTNVSAGGIGAVAIGNLAAAAGLNATSIGVNSQATGETSVAIGFNTKASTTNGVAIGDASFTGLTATNAVAIGYKNTVTGAGTAVLGSQVTATGLNSVVLGAGSDGSQSNVVSVGGKGTERKIVNVAAGTTTTDAVNLGQLNTAIASIPTGGGGDSVLYNSTTHDKVTFGGTAAMKAVTLSNVAAGQADTDAVNVKQLTDAGLVVNSTGGATNAFVAYDNNTSKDTITLKGTAGTTKITKLTNGTLSAASSDAVNGSQLFNAASSTAAIIGGGAALDPNTGKISNPAVTVGGTTYDNLAGAITAAGTAATDAGTAATAATAAVADAVKYDTTAHAKVTFGGTGAPVTLSNVAAGKADTDAVNVKQLTAMGGAVDSSGNPTNVFVAYDNNTSKDTITLKGTAGTTKITKLTNGTLSAASSDAVNGSQLFNAASSTAAIIGGGAALDPNTGKISNPAVTVGGTTYDNLAGAITAAGTAATDAGTAATAATAAVADAVKYDTTAHAKVTFGGTGAPVTLSNVAAGKADTDAVNVKQLTAMGGAVDSSGNPTNVFVAYDNNTSKDTITLKGTAGTTKITKLTNGTLSAASSDAVNGSQLFNAASSTAAIIGGGAALDPNTGKISNPSIKVGDTTYDTLAGAITQAALMGGDSADAVKYDTTAHDKVTLGGSGSTTPVTLSNVAQGVKGTDAVNLDQLTAIGGTFNSTGGVTNAFVAYDNNTSKDTITLKGTAGTTKITKLTNGTLSAASSDAVNGSQLFNAASSTAAIIGGGAALDPNTGTISKPAVKVGGTTFDNLAGAIVAAGTEATDAKAAVADAVLYDTTAHAKVTFGGTSAASPITLANVAAGTANTDAVNVGQLTAAGLNIDTTGKATNSFVAYDDLTQKSVTLGKAGTPVTVSNVAAGVAGTDAVNKNQLDAVSSSIGMVAPALKYLRFGSSDAQIANAVGTDALALGGNAYAMQSGAVAIGRDSNVSGKNAVALGLSANASGEKSVALGWGSSADDDNVVSVGSIENQRRITNVAAGTQQTDAVNLGQVEALIGKNTPAQQTVKSTRSLLGAQAAPVLSDVIAVGTTDKLGQTEAVGQDAIAVGLGTKASNDNAVAVGTNASAGGVGAVAVGNLAAAAGKSSTSIGVNSQSTGDNSVAIGSGAVRAMAANAIAIGNANYTGMNATNTVAIGYKNTVTGAGTIVLGNQITSVGANSVVLGSGSDGSQDNVVSVGAKGSERKIVNVAAGATTTDAVNYGQLTTALAGITGSGSPDGVVYDSSAHDKLTLGGTSSSVPVVLTNVAAGKMGSDAVNVAQVLPLATALGTTIDPTTGAVKAPSFTAGGKTADTVQGALTNLDSTIAGNTSDITNINTKIAGLGESLVSQASAGSDIMVASGKDGAHVDFAGQGVASRELINVSAGTQDTSAVNLSQLKPVVDALGGGAAVSPAGVVTGPTYTIGGKDWKNAGDAFKAVDGNLTQLNTTVADITAAGTGMVVQDPTSRDITVGALNDGTRVNFAGTAGNRVLTGVADGQIVGGSSDAVNGSQIAGISSSFATAIGGGSMMNPDGTVTIPSFTVDGKPLHNVGDAITNLDGRVTTVTNNYSDLQNEITNIKNSGVATPNAVAYDSAAHDQLTLGNKDTGTTTKISGVTAGDLSEGSTDAVNGGQLFDTNTKLATLEDSVQNIATTGSTSIGINGTNGINGANGVDGAPAVASATGNDAIAMGDNASASGDHAVVIGGGASGTADGTIAIGGNANSSGKDSIAIGNGATAPANNAVALGAGSVADRDNTVSVGSPDQQRQITNVAAGTQGTDAVNLNQMNQAVGGIARKAYSGIAAATALTMIPDVDANKTLSIGIGGGTFQGYAATAIGGTARITQNIKVRVGAGWSAAGTTVGAGASYQW